MQMVADPAERMVDRELGELLDRIEELLSEVRLRVSNGGPPADVESGGDGD